MKNLQYTELNLIGKKNSKSYNKRLLNQRLFNEFMSKNSKYFKDIIPHKIFNNDYGITLISNGGSIRIHYTNSHPNPKTIPPYTIGIDIDGDDFKPNLLPYNHIKGNFKINPMDRELFSEIVKIKSLHTKLKSEIYN